MYFGCYEIIELQPPDSRNILWDKAELSLGCLATVARHLCGFGVGDGLHIRWETR